MTTSPTSHGTSAGGIKGVIARHPIPAYLVIAFASSWSLTVLVPVSIMFGLMALFGPALGAAVVSWADGSTGELRGRITDWRESPRSYLSAFGIPLAVTAVALVAYVLPGNPVPGIGSISAIEVLIFVLVIGEEIGWRGFLMPRLRARMSLPAAGLVTGVIWATWHLPIYLAPNQGLAAFAVFAWWVVPFAVVMGFIVERARYSVLVATVMHGAANIAMPILLPAVDHTWTMVATGTVYLLLAVSLVADFKVSERAIQRAPVRSEGGSGMTALSVAIVPTPKRRILGGMFLGFPTVFRKELTEWLRGPKTLIVAGVSIAGAVFMTLIPYIAMLTNEAAESGAERSPLVLTMDPTTNVLLGWTGQTVALIAVVATMALVSAERDRGTLAWSLTNPVSPTSIIAAKFGAAFLVFSAAAVVLPLVVSSLLATIVYGGLPNLTTVATFGLLFLTLPAFYIALTVGLGTAIKSTAGVAGVAFAVMFVPQILGGLLPIIGEVSPTSIGVWAMTTATGDPSSVLTIGGWLVSMAAIVVGAKVVFDRQEF